MTDNLVGRLRALAKHDWADDGHPEHPTLLLEVAARLDTWSGLLEELRANNANERAARLYQETEREKAEARAHAAEKFVDHDMKRMEERLAAADAKVDELYAVLWNIDASKGLGEDFCRSLARRVFFVDGSAKAYSGGSNTSESTRAADDRIDRWELSVVEATDLNSVGLTRELCHGCWKVGSDTHWANVPWHRACVEKANAK